MYKKEKRKRKGIKRWGRSRKGKEGDKKQEQRCVLYMYQLPPSNVNIMDYTQVLKKNKSKH